MVDFKYLFEKKLIDTLKNECGVLSGKLLVGFSGGVDSTVLLYALNRIVNFHKLNFEIFAVHVNHNIRGEEAIRDMNFAAEFCKKQNIKYIIKNCDIPVIASELKIGLEEAARKTRYRIFDEISVSLKCDYILTAHNSNDNAETVLFNIIRGTGLDGASGIPIKRGKIIRPMLRQSREDIEKYAQMLELPHVFDSTNSDNSYSRNRIRNLIIPEIKKINPSAIEAINNFSKIVESAKSIQNSYLSTIELSTELPPDILKLKIRQMYENFCGKKLSSSHTDAVLRAIYNGGTSKISLPDKIEAISQYGKLSFKKITTANKDNHQLIKLNYGKNEYNDLYDIWLFEENKINSKNIYNLSIQFVLAFDKINGYLCARERKTGDSLIIKGINKNLKKCFINNKIPVEIRNKIPVICDNSGIICVPHIGIADRAGKCAHEKSVIIAFEMKERTTY